MSGRDKEAIGAWQMALLSENPGAVYPALVDALLRTGDGRQALDVIEEAPDAWPNDDERLKREAIALAMLGDYSGALPKLKDQLDNTKNDDQPLLFVAIQVLYKMHQQDKSLSPDNLQRFRRLRRAPPEARRTGSRHRRDLAARGAGTIKVPAVEGCSRPFTILSEAPVPDRSAPPCAPARRRRSRRRSRSTIGATPKLSQSRVDTP